MESNGDVSLLGGNKINKKYHNTKGVKNVPIEIGNFIETKLNSYYVRIYSNEQSQKNQIDRKNNQKYILTRLEKKLWLKRSDFEKARTLKNSGLTTEILEINYIDKTVLSNCGFAKLKTQEYNNASKGEYWKKKLLREGKISCRRSLGRLKTCSYKEYLFYKYQDRTLVYDGKAVYKETASQFTTSPEEIKTTDLIKITPHKREIGKPLEHLSFDFIHWIQQ